MDPLIGEDESSLDYSFGLDNPNFSDRSLVLEIVHPILTADPLPHKRSRSLKPTAPGVKTIRINSLILAARSPFFFKLFSNGTLESEQKHVKLQIEASEEVPFMDLLQYVYSNNILPTTFKPLLHLWVIANKFEFGSCMRDCARSLQNLPMTCESASLILELSPTLLVSEPQLQDLIDKANDVVAKHYQDFNGDEEEKKMLDLSLPCVEAVLRSNDLRVTSEDDVYNFVLSWARKHYPTNMEKRQEILGMHLLNLVRFPFMTTSLVKQVQTCSDIDHEVASEIVIRALHFKAETPRGRRCIAEDEVDRELASQYVERAYTARPLKHLVEFESQHKQSIAYLELTREELMNTFPYGEKRSERFHLDGHQLELIAGCGTLVGGSNECYFSLELKVEVDTAEPLTVNYEIALRMKPSKKFETWILGSGEFTWFDENGVKELHQVPWTDFIRDTNPHFIDGVLHLSADFTIKDH